MKNNKVVAYYRLSMPKKGKNKAETIRDAYGLEDQRREVKKFAADCGATIIGEFQEVETGTKKKIQREELEKAILMAQMHRATLVIGKQDRLGRNTHFITGLMEKGIKFVCADAPEQSELMIQLRAVIDEEEARRISERTKRGLAVAREKGKKLGSARPGHWKGREHLRGNRQATAASCKARRELAVKLARAEIDLICKLQDEGLSQEGIAARLNELGHVTTRGMPFTQPAVCRILRTCGRGAKPKKPGKGKCCKCGRSFRCTWEQRQQQEVGHPIYCLDTECILDVDHSSISRVVEEMLKRGKMRVDIADALNHLRYTTPHGKPFTKQNLNYIVKLLDGIKA